MDNAAEKIKPDFRMWEAHHTIWAHERISVKSAHGIELTAHEYFHGPDFYDIRDFSLALPRVDMAAVMRVLDFVPRRVTWFDEHYVAMLHRGVIVGWSWREPGNAWKFACYPAVEAVQLGRFSDLPQVRHLSPLAWLQAGCAGVCYF